MNRSNRLVLLIGIVLAVAASGFFAVLVVQKYAVAAIFLVLMALTLLAWHSEEPEHA